MTIWLVVDGRAAVEISPLRPCRVGSAPDSDVVVHGAPAQAWFVLRHTGRWTIRPEATDLRFEIDKRELPVGRSTPLPERDQVELTVTGHGISTRLSLHRSVPHPDPERAPGGRVQAIAVTAHGVVRVGRIGGGADLQLAGSDVALYHAELSWADGLLRLVDRSRGLGVFVEGEATGFARLVPGAAFVIGHHRIVVGPGEVRVAPVVAAGAPSWWSTDCRRGTGSPSG